MLESAKNNLRKWLKVSELQIGMRIAVPKASAVVCHGGKMADDNLPEAGEGDILWDEVISIEKVGVEQVYDIEVEGTHNFVAGHLIDSESGEHLTEEQEKEALSETVLNKKLWFGGIFAHNTYISGNLGLGITAPTAYLHLNAGTTAAGTAPLKFTTGANTTAAVAGQMEYDGAELYFTPVSTRETIAYISDITGASHNAVTLAAIGSTPNANGMTLSTQVLNLQPADGTYGGVVSTTTQTFAGAKTFTGTATFSNGTYSALFTGGNVGIGTTAPNNLLSVYEYIDFNPTDFNTKIGYQAGLNIVAGARYNTFLGYQAGMSSSGGSTSDADNNIMIGYQSGYSNTMGTSNFFSGNGAGYSNTTGGSNFFSGYESGYYNQTGTSNVSIGYRALKGAAAYTNSDYNIAIGYNAGYAIGSVADNNVFLGYQAGYSNTTGSNNIFEGSEAGVYNQTGASNTALGNGALRGVAAYTGSDHNIAIGTGAGYSISSDTDQNIFLGNNSGYSNTTGTSNFFSGRDAGYYNQTGTNNTALGFRALKGTAAYTGSEYNIAIGYSAGYSIGSAASNNIFLGFQSGYSNTTGTNNFFSGNGAGYYSQTGVFNVAIGSGALRGAAAYTGSSYNIAIGQSAGFTIGSTAENNVFLGRETGYNITGGTNNFFSGYRAGYQNTTGTGNYFLGYETGLYNQTSSYNTAIGYRSLRGTALYTGSHYNIALGYRAGTSISSDASSNTFIGNESGYSITSGDDNFFSGYRAGYFNQTGNNNIAIGNSALKGVSAYTGSDNNIAIGYNAGLSILSAADNNIFLGNNTGVAGVNGSSNILIGDNIYLQNTSGSSQLSIGNLIFATGGFGTDTTIGVGNVGIGTTAPGVKLDVNGVINTTSQFNIDSAIVVGGAGSGGTFYGAYGDTSNASFRSWNDANTGMYFPGLDQIGFTINGSDAMYISSAGKVGIGTTNPTAKLQIEPLAVPTNGAGTITYDNPAEGLYKYPNDMVYDQAIRVYAYKLVNGSPVFSSTYAQSDIVDNSGSSNDTTFYITWSWDAVAEADGYRILKYDPDYDWCEYDCYFDTSLTSFNDGDWSMDWTGGSTVTPMGVGLIVNGSVGIGTTAPSAQLHTTSTVRFANFGTGTLITDASGNVSVSSDERLKNVTGYFDRGLDDIMKINPIIFHWNALSGMDMENQYAGFSAQNIQGAIPEAVGVDSKGYLSLSDRPILAAAVNAIKTQQKNELLALAKTDYLNSGVGKVQNNTNVLAEKLFGATDVRYEKTTQKIAWHNFSTEDGQVSSTLSEANEDGENFGGQYSGNGEFQEIRIEKNTGADLSTYANIESGFLQFDIFVADADLTMDFHTEVGNQIDAQELQWNKTDHPFFVDGWNKVKLPISEAIATGEINWSDIDYFRIYFKYAAENEIKIANISFESSENKKLDTFALNDFSIEETDLADDENQQRSILTLNKEMQKMNTALAGVTDISELSIMAQDLENLKTQIASLVSEEARIIDLESQMVKLKADNQFVIDIAAALDVESLVYRDSLGNLDILNGKITAQNIEALAMVKAKDIEATETVKGASFEMGDGSSGQAVIPAGQTEVVIVTPYINEEVKISLTAKGSTAGKNVFVDEIIAGESFKVKIDAPAVEKEITFYWFVIK